MGAEASKQVQPPEGWEPEGARKSFEVISPVSDISNPSDIHKFSRQSNDQVRHQHGHVKVLAGQNKNQYHQDQPPNSANRHSSRRASRTVTATLPVATKIPRRSSSTGGNPQIPAPSSFYFPTKESERYAERAAKSANNCGNNGDKKDRFFQGNARQGVKKTTMRKKLLKKMTGCLDNPDEDEMDHVQLQHPSQHLVQANLPVAQIVTGTRGRKSSLSLERNKTAISRDVPLRKLQTDAQNKSMQRKNNLGDSVPEPHLEAEKESGELPSMTSKALHREDDYFDRLSMSPSSIPVVSPFASNTGINRVDAAGDRPSNRKSFPVFQQKTDYTKTVDRSSMPTSGLNTTMDMDAMTPMSQLLKHVRASAHGLDDSPIDSPVSDLFSSASSVPDMQQKDNMLSFRLMKTDTSVASSLMRFYTKTGPMGSSPLSYNSDGDENDEETQTLKGFSDEQILSNKKSTKIIEEEFIPSGGEGLNTRESAESHSSLYTKESKRYEVSNGEELQVLAHEPGATNEVISYRPSKEETLVLVKPQSDQRVIGHDVATFEDENQDDSGARGQKISKLESLFRPILPAFSTDDAQSLSSYDPREIKVTESAPGVIQSSTFISLARRTPSFNTSLQGSQIRSKKMSPSQLSIDTQPSPGLVKDMVSDQAENNAGFLFASDYRPPSIAGDPDLAGSSKVLISTAGARNRLIQRPLQNKVGRVSERCVREAKATSVSDCSFKSDRRVCFSANAVDNSAMERTASDLMDSAPGGQLRSSGIVSFGSSKEEKIEVVQEGDESGDFPPLKSEGSWICKEKDDASITPFLRFQALKETFGTNVAPSSSFAESIDLPDIENKASDLTDATRATERDSSATTSTLRSCRSIPESIPEEDEIEQESSEMSPENSIHWTYNEKGVTPYIKGKPVENAAKSPVRRFKDAKNKFSTLVDTKNPENVKSIIRPRPSVEATSAKNAKKIPKKSSGGLVSARIEELNTRVSEIRKMKRIRKKLTNPRLHTHNFDNKQPVRNRALLNYKTTFESADIEKSNFYMAAKFNVIPDVDEGSAISSLGPSPTNGSTNTLGTSPTSSANFQDDDVSRHSHATIGTSVTGRTGGTGATVATVVQQRDSRSGRYRAYSESAMSAASSAHSKLRKQALFRVSDGTKSLSSNDESTTLSAIIHKENEFFPPAALHLSPVQRTSMQAMKWRSLAAAVAEKDARSSKKNKKIALGARSNNNNN